MSAYIEPIKIALLVFPFLALAISTIFFVRQYRRYGRFIWSRGIILYSFVFYLLCAYFLVILPLPAISEVAQMTGPKMEWHLGASWVHFMQQTVLDIHDPGTYLPALKQGVVLEPLFNLLLTVPFGIYLRYYFNYSFKKTLLLSFCLTLFFELTQLTGLYFIYPRPYRLFDVNDLFVNTLGGVLGWVIAPIFTFLLPSREEIDAESYAKDTRVTVTRRFFAWAIDWVILNVFQTFLLLIVTLVSQKNMRDFTGDYWFFAVEVCLYFMLIPYLTNGQTLGKKMVRIRLMQEGRQRISFSALFLRYGLFYLIYASISRVNLLFAPFLQSDSDLLLIVSLLMVLLFGLLQFGFYLNLIWGAIRKEPRFFYEKRSKTYTISTVQPKEG
ncbi:VanZ family protein [Enterococcus sp.]|uniref:VanZ family protein n=1 Tax=Enterococcus sp. TaxID=35783 RepID=UPI00289E678E|nr:VanZ family protein [Enterococcus sp.]